MTCARESHDYVIPAWIAGIQVRKDASGDFHVNLDSSIPCWNDDLRLNHFVVEQIAR